MARSITVAIMLWLAGAGPASAQAHVESWRPEPLRFENRAVAPPDARVLTVDEFEPRWSPGWVRFAGGFVTATGTMLGLLAATWDDPDAVSESVVFGAYALGTMVGSAAVTAIWEKPNLGLAAGAALGAVPLLLAMDIEEDDAAGAMLLVAWIGAPFGAAAGQRLWSRRPGR